jgi:predicted MFS family arabinose efflux permease
MGEVFPSDIRSLAIGLTFSAELCISTANILIYPYLIDSFQFHGTFYFYAVIAFITMLWGMFTIPDNRGLSLAKVEANFATDKKMTDDMK